MLNGHIKEVGGGINEALFSETVEGISEVEAKLWPHVQRFVGREAFYELLIEVWELSYAKEIVTFSMYIRDVERCKRKMESQI